MEINKIESYVFDNATHEALFKLSKHNIIDSIDTPISSGKEALTFLGHLGKSPIVAKIYKVETSKFKNMDKYIRGDYRFKKVPREKRDIVLIWASKEYKNLTLALKAGVACPVPLGKEANIVVMSFIGKVGIPSPRLTDCVFDFKKVYPQIIENYAKLLYGAKLVHADFSAFNILIDPRTQKISLIDFGQAVVHTHPNSREFLKKDIMSIVDFINRRFRDKDLTYDAVLMDIKQKKIDLGL